MRGELSIEKINLNVSIWDWAVDTYIDYKHLHSFWFKYIWPERKLDECQNAMSLFPQLKLNSLASSSD